MDEETKIKREKVLKLVAELKDKGVGAIDLDKKLPDDAVIVVSRVSNFNPKDNDVWTLEENKSVARDLYCPKCSNQVVMSHAMFKNYTENGGTPNMIRCLECTLESI